MQQNVFVIRFDGRVQVSNATGLIFNPMKPLK